MKTIDPIVIERRKMDADSIRARKAFKPTSQNKIVDEFINGVEDKPDVQRNLQLLFKRIQAQAYAMRKAGLEALYNSEV